VFGGRGDGADPIPYAPGRHQPAGRRTPGPGVRAAAGPAGVALRPRRDPGPAGQRADRRAARLDTACAGRLDGWLLAAGARWGLDGAHRQGFDAPRDDAYTWQFALDRLLLGHASGGEDDIAGSADQRVAPWAELEGRALDALDALIRLLRVLARHQKSLADALPPRPGANACWGCWTAVCPTSRPMPPASARWTGCAG
jgi:exodeoxyribonuclease V gamma subunit